MKYLLSFKMFEGEKFEILKRWKPSIDDEIFDLYDTTEGNKIRIVFENKFDKKLKTTVYGCDFYINEHSEKSNNEKYDLIYYYSIINSVIDVIKLYIKEKDNPIIKIMPNSSQKSKIYDVIITKNKINELNYLLYKDKWYSDEGLIYIFYLIPENKIEFIENL